MLSSLVSHVPVNIGHDASSKSIYGDRYRQSLFLHMLIGVWRIIPETIEWLESSCGRADSNDGNDKQ